VSGLCDRFINRLPAFIAPPDPVPFPDPAAYRFDTELDDFSRAFSVSGVSMGRGILDSQGISGEGGAT